tara:strand:+ start:10339 stop:11556 length:1218 start_codon:yes stop_codon:yes gene_type:complete
MNFLNLKEVQAKYQEITKKGYSLDLTRGKPHSDQLSLSNKVLEYSPENLLITNEDIRNYGDILGLTECRKIGAELLECSEDLIIAGGNSSLTLMYQYLASLFFHGYGKEPWSHLERVSILCPVPGYDRHFKLCEEFGLNMVQVPLTGSGPNMQFVEDLVMNDDSIKGIWCVPKHSNPTGEIYSNECVEKLLDIAKLKEGDFRILWDNAYSVHDFSDSKELINIFDLAKEKNCLNSVVGFASTSKITFAGGGIGFLALSEENLKIFLKHYAAMVIGPDKINQQRHINFFKDIGGIQNHMSKHAEIIRPKFECVFDWLSKQEHGTWTKPTGGYFVSFMAKKGLAKEIISLAESAGLKLTQAGATYPYGIDSGDSNIRIAPTACSLEELNVAMEIFVVCLSLATLKNS